MSPLHGNTNMNHTCSVCQRSFTRKTHLTRHLRSHLNQRTYGCSICGRATFTRSDLLRRHVKHCSVNADGLPHSRKKACQTCIRRKVKCDLQKPCGKCVARGDDCVYQSHRAADTQCDGKPPDEGADPIYDALSLANLISDIEGSSGAGGPLESAGDSNLSSPPSMAHLAHPVAETSNLTPTPFDAPREISSSGSSAQTSEHASESDLTSQLVLRSDAGTSQSDFIIDANTAFLDDFGQLNGDSFIPFSAFILQHSPRFIPRPLAPAAEPITDPDTPETDIYIEHFLSSHCRLYPFLHLPTWSQSNASPLLLRAMRVCGALYVTTPAAENRAAAQFISDTLKSKLRNHIFSAFIQTPGNDIVAQTALFLAFASVQTVGLFHRCPYGRIASAAYHSMMIMMMRRSTMRAFVDGWEMPPVDPLNPLDAWRSWSCYETVKRLIVLAFLHDTLMPVFHNLPPSLRESELDIRLPCDDELWEAPDAYRWAKLASAGPPPTFLWAASPGTYLAGESLTAILADMLDPRTTAPAPLNRFASFVVIHALFRAIHFSTHDDHAGRLSIQHALTQWYIDRLADAAGARRARPDFTSSALPLYWLAQLCAAAPVPMSHVGPARFGVVKRWLREFWSVLSEAGEAGAGMRLAGVPDAVAAPTGPDEACLANPGAGLLEWIPRT